MTPLARFGVAFAHVLPAVEEAFRSGGGVSWEDYGQLGREAQADANRPVFSNLLGAEWLPSIDDIHERLVSDPPARVADVACGAGWSSIAIARAYPKVTWTGSTSTRPPSELAQANLAGTGVEDRVTFQHRDAGDAELAGSYELVTVFEAAPRPVPARSTCCVPLRSLVADGGAVLVMDERVAESFTAPGDEVERLMYGVQHPLLPARTASPTRPRPARARSCGPTRCAATPPRPGSQTSRCSDRARLLPALPPPLAKRG